MNYLGPLVRDCVYEVDNRLQVKDSAFMAILSVAVAFQKKKYRIYSIFVTNIFSSRICEVLIIYYI